MIEMPRIADWETAGTAATGHIDNVEFAYRFLDEVCEHHQMTDAWLVLRPPSRGPQVFRRGGRPVSPEDATVLVDRPAGVYSQPRADVGAPVSVACCEAQFADSAIAAEAAADGLSGFASRRVIDAALARAAACGARHRWSTSVVLCTTSGPGTPGQRWPALAAALGAALRSGDEVGIAGPGAAWVLLGNTGPDAVRPFVSRVRARLSASGWDDIDLLAATATTPQESVDPAELRRQAVGRLMAIGGDPGAIAGRQELELDLRLLPGVTCVGARAGGDHPQFDVLTLTSSDALRDTVLEIVRRRMPDASVSVTVVGGSEQPAAFPASRVSEPSLHPSTGYGSRAANGTNGASGVHGAGTPATFGANGSGSNGGNGVWASGSSGIGSTGGDGGRPPLRSITAAGIGQPQGRDDRTRVALSSATFDPGRGVSEVTLSRAGVRGTGRAPAGPLAGGVQATLIALGALGVEVPFYLVSAERVRGVPGEPVVVVLAPRRAGDDAQGTAERIGTAVGADDIEAASRAALSALNRFLAEPAAAP